MRHVWPECKVIHEFALCATLSPELPTALRAVLTTAANTRGAAPSPFFHCNIGHKFALCAPCVLRSAVVLGLITGSTGQKYLTVYVRFYLKIVEQILRLLLLCSRSNPAAMSHFMVPIVQYITLGTVNFLT